MPKAYLFSEEGRAGRGSNIFLVAFTALWILVSCAAGFAYFHNFTKANLTTLQRVYWPQYWWGSLKAAFIPFEPKSKYAVLMRELVERPADRKSGTKDGGKNDAGKAQPVVRACLNEEITADYDEDGYIHKNPDGTLALLLKAAYVPETKQVYWDKPTVKDSIARAWFRDHIYEGKSVTEFYYPAALCGGLLFVSGMGGAFGFRRYRIKRLLRGKVLRGTRELTPKEYAREMRRETGVGIEVFTQEGR
ncbi:MAG TPA: hypothetical protein VF297_03300 [Pyrinomonadaceae bacterium]